MQPEPDRTPSAKQEWIDITCVGDKKRQFLPRYDIGTTGIQVGDSIILPHCDYCGSLNDAHAKKCEGCGASC